VVTSDAELVEAADRIVLPGVGAFADCRRGLEAVPGMIEALNNAVIRRGAPFLGICVGCQLMAERGLEKSATEGLGWIGGDVVEIEPDDPDLKIPHMGWNTLRVRQQVPALTDVPDGSYAYFVHSYYPVPADPSLIATTTPYGPEFASSVARDNVFACQFHPEKSQRVGLAMYRNFAAL